jgi:hypothetical protein
MPTSNNKPTQESVTKLLWVEVAEAGSILK